MKPKWAKLAADMLDLAAEEFSNHNCNDWEWPKDWTLEERQELAEAMVAANYGKPFAECSPEERAEAEWRIKSPIGCPDWMVMAFLAGQLRRKE